MAGGGTLLAVMAHPDDEIGCAGTLLAQRARGDDVHVAWLTDGGMTESLGRLPREEVARRRREQARRAAEILDVEPHFLGHRDAALRATPDAAAELARLMARIRPDGVLTFGQAWIRGLRHPDHQAAGTIARDAITLARLAKVVDPAEPHRAYCPVFCYRGHHSTLPRVAVDVEAHLETMYEVGRFYQERVGFGDPAWIEERCRKLGRRWGVDYAEEYEAWESRGDRVVDALLPAEPAGPRAPDVKQPG